MMAQETRQFALPSCFSFMQGRVSLLVLLIKSASFGSFQHAINEQFDHIQLIAAHGHMQRRISALILQGGIAIAFQCHFHADSTPVLGKEMQKRRAGQVANVGICTCKKQLSNNVRHVII